MRKLAVVILSIIVFLIACSKKSERVKLEPGTPAYELAVAFSEKFDYLDPEKNNILVKTDMFEISTGEVVQQMQRIYGQRIEQLKQLPPNRLKDIIENNAKDLAERKLLVNTAMENNVTLSDTAVDSVLSIQYRSAGSKEKYLEFIATHNLKLDEVKEDIGKQLMVQRYLNRYLADQAEVTEEDIQKAYNEDKTASVQHILLMTQGKTDEEKAQIRKKMEGILEEARAGADFGELAKKYSEDPGSKDKGGLYENFGHGQMVKPFEDAAFSVPIGQISDIVETRYGYHIIKVIDRKKETEPLEKVRAQLESQIKRQKRNAAMDSLMTGLKEKVHFEIIQFS